MSQSVTSPSTPGSAFNYVAPDLTRHPPRSPRVRLGGFIHLPRLLDKARATIAKTNGEYHFNCPVDQQFFAFTGIEAESFLKLIATGKGDGELLAYVLAHAQPKRTPSEILAWSKWFEQRAPGAVEMRAFFNESQQQMGPQRDDIVTWFDLLDLDDYVSFNGRA